MKIILKACFLAFATASFLLPPSVDAQSCSCPDFEKLKNQYDKSEESYQSYIIKLQSANNKNCEAKAEEWLAAEFISISNFDTAELHLKNAERIYKQLKCHDSLLLFVYKTWAQLFYTKGDFEKAQEKCLQMLTSAEASNNNYETANANTMIAQLFNQTGRAENGIIYVRKALPYIDKITSADKKADIYGKVAKRFLWHYQDTKVQSSLDSSELFCRKQLEFALSTENSISISLAYNTLQGIKWERGDLEKAMQYLDSAFAYTRKDDYLNLSTNFFDKADILLLLNNYEVAQQMADSSLYYRKKLGNPAFIAESFDLLAAINKAKGNFQAAFFLKDSARTITDSIRNVEKMKMVSELEKKYNQEKNENTIKDLAQQKRIYILFALTALLGLIGLVFFIRQQSLKNKQRILEAEQRLNRARMNPHFFFNALSSLQSLALQGNDGKSIASNLSKFSHIMRETLESTYKEYITVEQEIEFLKEYLELQKVRFPEKFSYDIIVGRSVELDEVFVPSMILQPSVENSIEHGFKGINYPGRITICFDINEKELLISIIDNGKGFVKIAKESSEHISRASQIIKDRIYLLNIKLKTKATFSIENNQNGEGVTVLVKLPLLYKQDLKV